jgi:hypothetical protein
MSSPLRYILCFFLIAWSNAHAQTNGIYRTLNGKASFFSEAPVSDISASTDSVVASLNVATGHVAAELFIRSFKFPRALMKQHFNQRYMKSERFPKASFRGTISQKIPLDSGRSFRVTALGMLNVHGVSNTRAIEILVKVTGGGVFVSTTIPVKLRDHAIEVPTFLFSEIMDTIDVRIQLNLLPVDKTKLSAVIQ